MNAPYLIYFWHGRPMPKTHFAEKVDKLCRKQEADGTYFWDGTLEEFATNWGDKFIYLPPTQAEDGKLPPIKGTIAITQYGSFGAR